MSTNALFNKLFRKRGFENNPGLTQALWLISNSGRTIVNIEPFQYMAPDLNVATQPNFDPLPFIANSTYFVTSGFWAKTSTTQTGIPHLIYYEPFADVFSLRYAGSSMANNTVTLNLGVPGNILTSRVQWQDNGATVGVFSLQIGGFKITYSAP